MRVVEEAVGGEMNEAIVRQVLATAAFRLASKSRAALAPARAEGQDRPGLAAREGKPGEHVAGEPALGGGARELSSAWHVTRRVGPARGARPATGRTRSSPSWKTGSAKTARVLAGRFRPRIPRAAPAGARRRAWPRSRVRPRAGRRIAPARARRRTGRIEAAPSGTTRSRLPFISAATGPRSIRLSVPSASLR